MIIEVGEKNDYINKYILFDREFIVLRIFILNSSKRIENGQK